MPPTPPGSRWSSPTAATSAISPLALPIALGRVAFGVVLTAAPDRIAPLWVGESGPAARLLMTALGARDLALGLGAVAALRRGSGARGWMLGGVAADLADLAATLRWRAAVPPRAAAAVTVLAGGGALGGLLAYSRLEP
jgi:hypothetical protein